MNKLQKGILRVAPFALLVAPLTAKASTTAETVAYFRVVSNDLIGSLMGSSFQFVGDWWQILIYFTFALVLIAGFWRKIKSWISSLFRR